MEMMKNQRTREFDEFGFEIVKSVPVSIEDGKSGTPREWTVKSLKQVLRKLKDELDKTRTQLEEERERNRKLSMQLKGHSISGLQRIE